MTGSKKVVFEPVGNCIYCGRTDVHLTLEHVFPYALGGGIELPASSCKVCGAITGKFEQLVMRTMLGNFRVKHKAPTRRPKERPKVLDLNVLKGDVAHSIKLEPEHHPGSFALPVLSLPRLITGKAATGLHQEMGLWTFPRQIDLGDKKIARTDGYQVGTIRFNAFMRFLAKMAHAYVSGARGPRSFVPLLPSLILGQTKSYADFIGSRARKPVSSDEKSNFAFQALTVNISDTPHVCCEIELFPTLCGPTYVAVVGIDLKDRLVIRPVESYLNAVGNPLDDPDQY